MTNLGQPTFSIVGELAQINEFIGPKGQNAKDPFVYEQAFDLIKQWKPTPENTTSIEKKAGFDVVHLGLYWPGFSMKDHEKASAIISEGWGDAPEDILKQSKESWEYINALGVSLNTIGGLALAFMHEPKWDNLHKQFKQLQNLHPEEGTASAQIFLGIIR